MFIWWGFLFLFSVNAWKPILQRGFLGLIGIHGIEKQKNQSVYEAFTKDGIIQGVFIDIDTEGKQIITPIKQMIHTQKQRITRTGLSFPINILTTFIVGMIQMVSNNYINLLGTANTALIQDTHNKSYALFERDLPYEIMFDFQNQTVSTGSRKYIPGIQTFSGHSKKRSISNNNTVIDSIEYNVMNHSLTHHVLSGDLQSHISQTIYPTIYIPIVHDFFVMGKDDTQLCWVESPFVFQQTKHLTPSNLYDIPIGIDKHLPTYFHVGNQTFIYDKGIAVFHIAHVSETKESYNIYTSVYENLHFSEDIKHLSGTYCCIRLDRKTRQVRIFKNHELLPYNLDFPVLFENKVILRNVDPLTQKMNGFIVCNKLNIVKKLFFDTMFINGIGEPVVVKDGNHSYLMFFVEDVREPKESNLSYLIKWDLTNDGFDYYPLNISFQMGFHSFWIPYISFFPNPLFYNKK